MGTINNQVKTNTWYEHQRGASSASAAVAVAVTVTVTAAEAEAEAEALGPCANIMGTSTAVFNLFT